MGKISYVCGICSQDFTRKYSAERHNRTIHLGHGVIFHMLEYILACASGVCKYQNPRTFRRPQRNFPFTRPPQYPPDHSTYGSIPSAYNPNPHSPKPPQYPPDHSTYGSIPSAYNPNPHSPSRTYPANNLPNSSEMGLPRASKINELRLLANKHLNPMEANLLVSLAERFSNQGNDLFLNQQLELFRMKDKYRM